MSNTWPTRLLFALIALAISIYFIAPTFIYFTLDEEASKEVRQNSAAFLKHLPAGLPQSHIVPGLDLQGGVHIVLGVDLKKALADRASRISGRLKNVLEEQEVGFKSVLHLREEGAGDRMSVQFNDDAAKSKFLGEIMRDYFNDLTLVSEKSDNSIVLRVHPDFANKLKRDAVDQTMKTINNRIDKMGVVQPRIERSGEDRIQIQLPGYDDPEEAKNLIGRTAQLNFQMCDDENEFLSDLQTSLPEWATVQQRGISSEAGTPGKDMYLWFPAVNFEEMKTFMKGKVPAGLELKYSKVPTDKTTNMRSYTLHSLVELSGDDLVDARVQQGDGINQRTGVSMTFSPGGGKLFGELTTKNVGKRMAIVLEDTVDSAPVINGPILGGSASITMGSNGMQAMKDAKQLADVLKSGALPAPVQFREERSVGPSLGKIAVDQGKKAFMLGGFLVIMFMLFYYRGAGVISVVGIMFNLAFLAAFMSWWNATVTLPGLAGLLLTIGMAVDANIIIIERIREELRAGKRPMMAVKAGYDHALSAILDANVTTMIAGFVLYQFGTGPVKNFAFTLLLGTITSVVSAVFITRIFFDMKVNKDPDTLSV